MSTSPANSRTNLELLNDLRTPVGRFYPLDLHVHSLGSYDVCMSGSFESLPERLRSEVLETLKDSTLELPLGRQPVDAGEFDEKMASSAALVQSFYQSLLDRRNELAETEGLAEGDNWAIVGITDHNTSHFSSKLSQWAWDKKSSDHLIVFPGLELEVEFPLEGASKGCRVHILCLFAPCTSASDIRIAINDAQPAGHQPWCFGSSISTSDLPALVSALRSHAAYPAICIGAHVWSRKGIEREPKKAILASVEADIIRVEGELERARSEAAAADIEALERQLARLQARLQDSEGLHGDVLALIGKCGFDALQVKDQSQEVHYRRLHRFRDEHGRAVPLVSSDAHTPSNVFTCGSGIPYGKVSIDAIADGSPTDLLNELRGHTLRFGETRMTYASPGRVTHWIEGLEIVPDASDARGFWTVEDSTEKAFTFALSRNLNCFVGGRGSGKSAGVEAIAFLSRESEFQEEARKNPKEQADWYVRARATLRGCRLRLVWKSSGPTEIGGLHKRALIVSRYFDPAGRHENFDLRDARGQAIVDDAITLPQVRILRVHEIEQTAKPTNLRELFDDLCGSRIDSLSAEIDGVRSELEVQRSRVVSACERAAELTGEGGPLRQYGIRKKQFEAVDTPELRERFEEVDHADDVAKSLSNAREQWNEVNATESLDMLEGELDSFFEATTEGLVDEQQEVLPGYETLHRLVAGPQTEADSHRSDIVSSLQATKDAISRFDVALSEETDSAANMLKERRDALASEGLPTGSSERETKKRAFEAAKEALASYQEAIEEVATLLSARESLHAKLVATCQERTILRKTRADELTEQLARDLDPKILAIKIDARPRADRAEFEKWLEKNVDGAFQRYRSHRRSALLESGLMPLNLRELLLDDGTPSVKILETEQERAEDGRIDENDAHKILTKCRGRKKVVLDEADTWTPEFIDALPEEIRHGIVTFPLADSGPSLCIDRVLQLDEVVLNDTPEVLLNDRPGDPESELRPLDLLSPGQRCSAILPILLLSGDYPLVIDQPEENLDNRLIRQVIVNILGSMKLRRQVIIATHNPNLPVLGDVEQCVILQATGRNLSSVVAEGDLDSANVAKYITDIMEGGREAFQYRQSIYQSHWKGMIGD